MSTPTSQDAPQEPTQQPTQEPIQEAAAGSEPEGSGVAAETPADPTLTNSTTPAAAPAAPAPPVPPVSAASPRTLSTFLKVSIILLVALSIASIALVFVGDFEGRVERITATFLIFAVFVVLTALDTSRGQRNGWYAPVALIANSYILALMLIVTWMSPGGYFLSWEIFWRSILVIGVVRAVVGCCQLLIGMGDGKPEPLSRFAFITSVLAVVSGILFTAPLAIEVFNVEIPELYWKISVAALLLTALGLAITLLLRWSYGSADRETARRERAAAVAATAAQAPVLPANSGNSGTAADAATGGPIVDGAQAAQPLLPWPTFADGRPIPAGPDGQPDFSVPGAPQPPAPQQ